MSLTCAHENLELSTASIYSYSDSTVSTNDLAPAGVREGSAPVPLLAESSGLSPEAEFNVGHHVAGRFNAPTRLIYDPR